MDTHTGYLTEPADDPTTCGEPAIKYDDLYAMVEEADANGYPVRLHAIGNGAVKQALDVFEAVQKKNGPKRLRNAIEHIESCRPEDIGRFTELGVVPSMQPIHSVLNVDGYPKLLGEKWRPYMWPIKSIVDTGAVMALHRRTGLEPQPHGGNLRRRHAPATVGRATRRASSSRAAHHGGASAAGLHLRLGVH